MSRKQIRSVRSLICGGINLSVTVFALVTSFVFALWFSRTLSPQGEWLQNSLTAFGYPVAWLLLTLLYATLLVTPIDWLFRLLWPKPTEDDHDR